MVLILRYMKLKWQWVLLRIFCELNKFWVWKYRESWILMTFYCYEYLKYLKYKLNISSYISLLRSFVSKLRYGHKTTILTRYFNEKYCTECSLFFNFPWLNSLVKSKVFKNVIKRILHFFSLQIFMSAANNNLKNIWKLWQYK